MTESLLPPFSSQLERAVEQLIASVTSKPLVINQLWDPWQCPLELLPWLAWANSVDDWMDSWPESIKRQVIANAYEVHQYKGTPYATTRALDALGIKTQLIEWWEQHGSGVRGTMKVQAMVNDNLSGEADGLLTAQMLQLVSRCIESTKRGVIHVDVELGIALDETLAVCAALAPSIGWIDQHADLAPVSPDTIELTLNPTLVEHRYICQDHDALMGGLTPDNTQALLNVCGCTHQIDLIDYDFLGVA